MLTGAQPLLSGEYLTLFVTQKSAQPFKSTRHNRQCHSTVKTAHLKVREPLLSFRNHGDRRVDITAFSRNVVMLSILRST